MKKDEMYGIGLTFFVLLIIGCLIEGLTDWKAVIPTGVVKLGTLIIGLSFALFFIMGIIVVLRDKFKEQHKKRIP